MGMPIMPPSNLLRPSRSTHRLAAWRTRLSSQGEPSAKLSCQGHTCGCGLEWMTMPRWRSAAIASGAGASIQSTWPDNRAAVRALASGMGNITTRSILGVRLGSQ